MGRIRILPENLTNKIAAGEVVERPASVVKELMENALDAGAREIVVDIESGGRKLIRLTDDGSGMSREDALLALERHATSKISSDDDLFNLSTLGFRGEALPSVASVSRFTLASRQRGALEGTEIYVEGGAVRDVKSCGMAEGTVVTVRNLFFNTPARLKFLKSIDTESGHVGDVVTRMALSRPDVRVTYRCDGKAVFRALNGSLNDRIATLLGKEMSAGLFPVEHETPAVRTSGFLSGLDPNRSVASHMYTFVNGRYVRDKVIQHAVLAAYRQVLERGRYPVVVLFLNVDPREVDVNVHPTKHEVRFRRQGEVHDGIVAAMESILRGAPWQKGHETPRPAFVPAAAERPTSGLSANPSVERVAAVREAMERYQPAETQKIPFPAALPATTERITPQSVPFAPAVAPPQREVEPAGYFSSLAVIGQYNAAYILCQEGQDLVIVDQHAAHERVAFEALKRQLREQGVESQGLLFPQTLDLSFGEAAVVGEHRDNLDRVGFGVEHFGGATFILKSVPRLLADGDYVRTFRDILEELASIGRNRTFQDLAEDVLSRIACHSVVRGSHTLSRPEIAALFSAMDGIDFSGTCPHGRPVSRKLSRVEIERMFKRQ